VENWHYSGCLPSGKLVKLGVWEGGKFIGVVLFGRGANNRMCAAYGLEQTGGCELTRVALTKHAAPVSRIVAIAIRFLKAQSAGLRMIISYADPKQGHQGGIYQAGNWIYTGRSQAQKNLLINGVSVHKRAASAKYGTASPSKIGRASGVAVSWGDVEWKHTYIMPLDAEMRERIAPLVKPYPKRDKQAMTGDQSEQRQGSTDRHAPITEVPDGQARTQRAIKANER
jgi:hypothetical protein